MQLEPLSNLSRIAIHTQTTKPWSLAQCIDHYNNAGIRAISVWRSVLEPTGAAAAGRMLKDAGMSVPALVRGGFFPALDAPARQAAIDINRTCIDEAAEIGAQMVVLVPGAVPGLPLDEARKHVADGIAAIVDHAAARNIKLAIEPLHPMYAADRSCINRIADARRICQQLPPLVGVAVDVYHTWWDPDLPSEITQLGKANRLFAFHVCDWRIDTRDLLSDRGLMGEGCINLPQIRAWMQDAGFAGLIEVEIFSERYWGMDQGEYLKLICEACLKSV